MFHDQRRYEQQCQEQPADPPCHGRPEKPHRRLMHQLEEENAGDGQSRAREKETRSQNEGNAVLGALKPDQRYRSKNECEQPRGDLQIALKDGIGRRSKPAQPESRQENKQETTHMEQQPMDLAAIEVEGKVAHSAFLRTSTNKQSFPNYY